MTCSFSFLKKTHKRSVLTTFKSGFPTDWFTETTQIWGKEFPGSMFSMKPVNSSFFFSRPLFGESVPAPFIPALLHFHSQFPDPDSLRVNDPRRMIAPRRRQTVAHLRVDAVR